jgi:hypothetical protein
MSAAKISPFAQEAGLRQLSPEHLDDVIRKALVALDSTGTTAPTCRISKFVLLDLVNVARLHKGADA